MKLIGKVDSEKLYLNRKIILAGLITMTAGFCSLAIGLCKSNYDETWVFGKEVKDQENIDKVYDLIDSGSK